MHLLYVFAQIALIAQDVSPLPSNWEQWGIIGFLLFAVMGLSTAVVWLVKWKRDAEENINEAFVARDVYLDALARLSETDKRCQSCMYVNGETLRKIYEILGEVSASGNLNVQALAAIRQTLDNALLRGGN